MNNTKQSYFLKSLIITTIVGLGLIFFSFNIGKDQLFLLLNGDGGFLADFFFTYCTYLGDGIIWVPVILLIVIYRKKLLPLVFSAIIVSTLFVQISKNFIFSNEARPTNGISQINLIHTVKGVELHSNNSFPSGHTTTVFCIYFLGCLVIGGNTMLTIGFALALLTGYSRIYLAQHYPLDVGAGMITAVVSIYLSLWIQQLYNNKQKNINNQ